MTEGHDNLGFHLFPGLTLERWRVECRLVEERYSLFRAFAQMPFFGFRGIVARCGAQYNVTVVAAMDKYPKYQPWVFVSPAVAGANANGKLRIDVPWNPVTSAFADVVELVVRCLEEEARTSPG